MFTCVAYLVGCGLVRCGCVVMMRFVCEFGCMCDLLTTVGLVG